MEQVTLLLAIAPAIALGLVTVAVKARRPRESPTVALVRRRRELLAELRRLVPDELEAGRILQTEAQRLAVSRSSPEALEAAIERATREGKGSAEKTRHRAG
jgi:hypothetical protein